MMSTVQSHLEFSCSHSRPVAVGSTYQRRQRSGYRERDGRVRCARRQTGVPYKTNTSSAQSVSYECTASTGGKAAGGRESWGHYTGTSSLVPVRPVLSRHTLRLAIKNRYALCTSLTALMCVLHHCILQDSVLTTSIGFKNNN